MFKQQESTTPGTGLQQDAHRCINGKKKNKFALSETLPVLDPLEVQLQHKPQEVCILALGDVLCYTEADL